MVLTVKQMAIIKRVAQSVSPNTNKKAKLQDKIIEAAKQIHDLDAAMEDFQVPVRSMTNGLTTEDIVRKVIVNGAAKYEPNPEVVRFNESTRVYEFIDEPQEKLFEQPAPVSEQEAAIQEVVDATAEVTDQEEEAMAEAIERRAGEEEIVNPFED